MLTNYSANIGDRQRTFTKSTCIYLTQSPHLQTNKLKRFAHHFALVLNLPFVIGGLLFKYLWFDKESNFDNS
jgi:hypothetical protein